MRQRAAPVGTYGLSEESVRFVFVGLLAVGALSPTTLNALFQGSADEGFARIPPTIL